MATRRLAHTLCLTGVLLARASCARAQVTQSFDTAAALEGWQIEGPVHIDTERAREGGSLRIEPGGRAIWQLRDADGSGMVDFWVYEDTRAPVQPKTCPIAP